MASHHASTTADGPAEKKVNEEVEAAEQDIVFSSKERAEEDDTNAKQVPTPATPLSESEGSEEDKQIEPPVVEVHKTGDAGVIDVPVKDKMVEKDYIPDFNSPSVPKPVTDAVEFQLEKKFDTESVAKDLEEQPNIVDDPESLIKAAEGPEEPLEVLPVDCKESEVVVKDIQDSQVVSTDVRKPEPVVPMVEVEPEEQSKVAEQIETVSREVQKPESVLSEVEPKESLEDLTVKNKETLDDKVEDTTISLKEDKETCKEEEPSAIRSSEQVVSTNQKAEADTKEDGGESSLPVVTEMAVVEDEKKHTTDADVVNVLSEEAVEEMEKVGGGHEEKTLKTEGENEERNVVTEESTQPNKVEDVKSSISNAEVTEKTFDGENAGKDVELVENKNEENRKDEGPALVETDKDGQIEGKLDKVTATVIEQVKVSQESEPEVKEEESVKTDVDKLEKEKIDVIAKSDVKKLELSPRDGDDTKTSQDLPKVVLTKSTQKQSRNIISKVKQSLVKAKKAIVGKSPNPKTLSTETQGDIKVN